MKLLFVLVDWIIIGPGRKRQSYSQSLAVARNKKLLPAGACRSVNSIHVSVDAAVCWCGCCSMLVLISWSVSTRTLHCKSDVAVCQCRRCSVSVSMFQCVNMDSEVYQPGCCSLSL